MSDNMQLYDAISDVMRAYILRTSITLSSVCTDSLAVLLQVVRICIRLSHNNYILNSHQQCCWSRDSRILVRNGDEDEEVDPD